MAYVLGTECRDQALHLLLTCAQIVIQGTRGDTMSSATAFSAELRSAISTSGLSLDRIQVRLQERGIPVSVTALSYWQSGKRQPERQRSLQAILVLEQILDVPTGSLLSLLPPPRPRGVASRRQLN